MQGCKDIGVTRGNEHYTEALQAALDAAHRAVRMAGSTTACICQLRGSTLVSANVGDSGFVVIRDGQIIHRTTPAQHFFDCPLQFGAYPEYVDGTDTAADAELQTLEVCGGDVIVMASDGLWDNMYDDQLLALVPRGVDDCETGARRVAEAAHINALDPLYRSPYTRAAIAEGFDIPWWEKLFGLTFEDGAFKWGELRGGKIDDITVVAAVVHAGQITKTNGSKAHPTLPDDSDDSNVLSARVWIDAWRARQTATTPLDSQDVFG